MMAVVSHRFNNLLFNLFLINCLIKTCCGNNINTVPLVGWSSHSDRPITNKFHHSGKSLTRTEFSENYLKPLTDSNHHLVVYLQDKVSQAVNAVEPVLSMGYDSADSDHVERTFEHLQVLLDRPGSFHLERVDDPIRDILALEDDFDYVMHVKKDEPIPFIKRKSLILVHLPSTSIDERIVTLKRNDEIIHKRTQQLREQGLSFNALYTAERSEAGVGSAMEVRRNGRKLLNNIPATVESNHTFINMSGCFVMFANSINFTVNSTKWRLPPKLEAGEGSYCVNDTALLNLDYSLPEMNLTTLNMSIYFNFDLTNIMWRTMNMTVMYDGYQENGMPLPNASTPIYMGVEEIQAPAYFSYSCSNISMFTRSLSNWKAVWVYMESFQVQAFYFYNPAEFGRYNDCIGFFSKQVWTFLLTLFALLVILLPGINMISNIKTMDRHEDPKGKHIVISTE